MKALAAVAALVLFAPSGAAAQDRPPVIRSGVDLVMVDVQVVDGKGAPVADLKPTDFEVTIGGRRRAVVSAELVRYNTAAGSLETKRPDALPAAQPVDAPRRMYVIAVDEHSIRVGAARSAMEAARRFIDRLDPRDLVGLYAYPTGTAQVDLTTNHAEVIAALDKVTAMFQMPRSNYNISPSEAVDIASQDRQTTAEVLQRECRTDVYCRRELPLVAQSMVITFEMTITQSLGGLRGLIAGWGRSPAARPWCS
jgi:VWFA-related protein